MNSATVVGRYAVYLLDSAAEALGPVGAPFIQKDASGPHIVAAEVDTGGALCELTLHGKDAKGVDMTVEMMIPLGMIKMILTIVAPESIGFQPRR